MQERGEQKGRTSNGGKDALLVAHSSPILVSSDEEAVSISPRLSALNKCTDDPIEGDVEELIGNGFRGRAADVESVADGCRGRFFCCRGFKSSFRSERLESCSCFVAIAISGCI